MTILTQMFDVTRLKYPPQRYSKHYFILKIAVLTERKPTKDGVWVHIDRST